MPTKLTSGRYINTNIDDVPFSPGRKYRPTITRSESEDPDRAIVVDTILLKLYTKQKELKQKEKH